MRALLTLIQELNQIAEQADRERLAVWYPQLKAEYPDLCAEIEHCKTFDDPADVLPYLRKTFSLLDLVMTIMPPVWQGQLSRSVVFLHGWLKEGK